MATWTNIPDTVLEPGKPVRAVDALALRDNAIAIAEGAPNAPRIAGQQGPVVDTGGIFNGAVTNPKIANNAINNQKISDLNAGKLNAGTVPGARIPAGLGGVGTYALLSGGGVAPGGTTAGSNLTYSSAETGPGIVRPSGTWRQMGDASAGSGGITVTVWVRIS